MANSARDAKYAAGGNGRSGGTGPSWRHVALSVVFMMPCAAFAQIHLQSYAFSNGAGFSSGESVRIGVSIGLPFTGLSRSTESAGGSGFWYATRDKLFIVSTEHDNPQDEIPNDFELQANYPNPFNPTTRIRYGVPSTAYVRLAIFNVLGQMVSQPVSEQKNAGYYDLDWDGRDASGHELPSGLYFYRLTSARFAATRSMILQR